MVKLNFEHFKLKGIASWRKAKEKGEVDDQIIGIIELLNSHPNLYTTSSCFGRITLSATNPSSKKYDHYFFRKWHYLITFQDFISSIREWLSKREDKFLWIKVFPFILHVGCKDLSTAEELVKVGLISGMKESGIFELRNRIMVRIEGVDKLELPIAFKDRLLVEEEYLRVIYHTAVIRFLRNLKKVILFTKNLRETFFKEKITNLDLKGLESKIRQHEDLAKEIALKD